MYFKNRRIRIANASGYPGDKLTDVVNSPLLDDELSFDLRQNVQSKLAGEYLHISKRSELEEAVKKELTAIILPECKNNPGDPLFIKFREAATEVIKILKN